MIHEVLVDRSDVLDSWKALALLNLEYAVLPSEV